MLPAFLLLSFEIPLSFVINGIGLLLGKKHPSHHIAVINLLHGSLLLILQPRNCVGWFEEKSSAPFRVASQGCIWSGCSLPSEFRLAMKMAEGGILQLVKDMLNLIFQSWRGSHTLSQQNIHCCACTGMFSPCWDLRRRDRRAALRTLPSLALAAPGVGAEQNKA